jgi:NCS2 family nucleobase:cation symporter-2
MMDARKTFVIGVSLILGLSVDMLPGVYASVPGLIVPAFRSSLSVSTLSALLLNLLFRIGIAQRAKLHLDPGVNSSDQIFTFMEAQGGAWGARREVIDRAKAAINEFVEGGKALELTKGLIEVEVSFDEFYLDVDIRYDGELMEFPLERPTGAELLDDERTVAKLAGYLIKNYVDRVRTDQVNGRCRIQLHLVH